MKCLIINGSPRKGSSFSMAATIKEEILKKDSSVIFEEIMLSDYDIPFCLGCATCFKHGESECPHYKKVHPVVEKMEEANVLVITSPVYALGVSGLIKNFFDHTAYFFHRPKFFDKHALVVVSTAGGGHKEAAKYMRDVLKHYGFNKVFILARALFDISGSVTENVKQKCRVSANNFYLSIAKKKLSDVSPKRIIFYNMWRAMSLSSRALPCDKEYWQESALFRYEYSPLIKINILNKLLGKISFAIFSKFIK